jgi:hypothetical protein
MSSVTTTLAIAAGIAGGSGAAYAGHKAASAATKGAELTTTAANYAADKTSQAAAASLAFEQQKDREAQAQAAATQKANYDQWAAKETRMNDIRTSLGMPAHPIPAYVPTTTPGSTPPSGTTPPVPGSGPSPGLGYVPPRATPPGVNPANPANPATAGNPTDRNVILQNLTNVYKTLGVSPTGRGTGPTDIAYMADQVAKTGGWTSANAGYWPDRIKQELAKAGGGAPGASPTPGPANTLAAFLPTSAMSAAPGAVRAPLPYLNPNGNIYNPTIGSYAPQY